VYQGSNAELDGIETLKNVEVLDVYIKSNVEIVSAKNRAFRVAAPTIFTPGIKSIFCQPNICLDASQTNI